MTHHTHTLAVFLCQHVPSKATSLRPTLTHSSPTLIYVPHSDTHVTRVSVAITIVSLCCGPFVSLAPVQVVEFEWDQQKTPGKAKVLLIVDVLDALCTMRTLPCL